MRNILKEIIFKFKQRRRGYIVCPICKDHWYHKDSLSALNGSCGGCQKQRPNEIREAFNVMRSELVRLKNEYGDLPPHQFAKHKDMDSLSFFEEFDRLRKQ